jgi:hypothetical protein
MEGMQLMETSVGSGKSNSIVNKALYITPLSVSERAIHRRQGMSLDFKTFHRTLIFSDQTSYKDGSIFNVIKKKKSKTLLN